LNSFAPILGSKYATLLAAGITWVVEYSLGKSVFAVWVSGRTSPRNRTHLYSNSWRDVILTEIVTVRLDVSAYLSFRRQSAADAIKIQK